MSNTIVNAGFMPLTDAAVLICAREFGFCEDENISLELIRETSWANIRDRMAVRHFDVAHMLGPMPVAASLGLTPIDLKVMAPMALGLGGNAISISDKLAECVKESTGAKGFNAHATGTALRHALPEWGIQNGRPVNLGVVHTHSAHNYDLRYWLAANGIDPDHDVNITVMPPSLLPAALEGGNLDGFCVGEPWNSVAVETSNAHVLTTKSNIWSSSPEKVLGVLDQFYDEAPALVEALIRALVRSAQWCAQEANHSSIVDTLSRKEYLDVSKSALTKSLSGRFRDVAGNEHIVDDFFLPNQRAANFPWQSHALWFYSQMVRWGQAEWNGQALDAVRRSYRPDIYRSALASTDIDVPLEDTKTEGNLSETKSVASKMGHLQLGPDGFFDQEKFDPSNMTGYILNQSKNRRTLNF